MHDCQRLYEPIYIVKSRFQDAIDQRRCVTESLDLIEDELYYRDMPQAVRAVLEQNASALRSRLVELRS